MPASLSLKLGRTPTQLGVGPRNVHSRAQSDASTSTYDTVGGLTQAGDTYESIHVNNRVQLELYDSIPFEEGSALSGQNNPAAGGARKFDMFQSSDA